MSNPKETRKQLRNIAQELLPTLLNSELGEAIRKDLSAQIQTRLDVVIKEIKTTLEQIEQRSKDVQGYLVRQTSKPVPAQKGEANERSEQKMESQQS